MQLDGLPSTVMPSPAVSVTFDLLTPKSNQHIYEPICILDQNWVKFPSLAFRYGVHKALGMHILTRGRTDPKTVCLGHRSFSVAGA